MTDVLLATSAGYPDGETGHEHLDAAFAARGLSSRWFVWDDPAVDWSAARLVCVRSTWDYDTRREEFLAWAEGLGRSGARLLNGVEAFRWNTDKRYLADLADLGRVPVVPTVVVDDAAGLPDAVRRFGTAVVKPRVGAGGRGVTVVRAAAVTAGEDAVPGDDGPWIVQPLLESVRVEGEVSVFVLGGRAVGQVAKVATAHDIRVHEEHGGRSSAVDLTPEAAGVAVETVAVTNDVLGTDLAYARVDLLRHEGTLCVSEVEIIEPGLYLDVLPAMGEAFVDVVAARL